jgi:hypothetical protein
VKRISMLLVAVLVLVLTSLNSQGVETAVAQTGPSLGTNTSDAQIVYPPPVYVLRGTVQVIGTANLAGQITHFLEYRQLNDDLSIPDPNADWIPATLPNRIPVEDDVLGEWDTTETEDGIYELRLTINVRNSGAQFFRVAPLRIENEFSPQGATPTLELLRITPTRVLERPTLAATPTAISAIATVTARVDANVRSGDGTNYPVVGNLLTGESAAVIGISATGSGWYYIQLENGRRGFISPTVVNISGNTLNLPTFFPPATPTPTLTPTPIATGDLLINGHATVPDRPRCGEQFDVQLNVTNSGTLATSSSVLVRIQDVDIATGVITTVGTNFVPVMQPGQNFVVVIPLTISGAQFAGTDHRITATVDANNQVSETNESNNSYTFDYRLREGTCQ